MVHHVEDDGWRLTSKPQPFGIIVGDTGGDGRDQQVGNRRGAVVEHRPGAEPRLQPEAVGGGEQVVRAGRVAGHDVGPGRAELADGGQGRAGGRARAQDRHAARRLRARLGERVHDALHVGVVAVAALGAEHHRVRAAGGGRQVVDVVEQRQHRALERHGQAQARPLLVP